MRNCIFFLSMFLSIFIWNITIASSHKLNSKSVDLKSHKEINFKKQMMLDSRVITQSILSNFSPVAYNMLGTQATKKLVEANNISEKSLTSMMYFKLLN